LTKRQQPSHTAGLIQQRKMKATILKVMISDGKTLNPGDIVDVSGWRHTRNLVSGRYIKLIEEEAPKAVKPVALPVDVVALPVDEEVKPKETKKKAKEAE
jgi:hypothetical protein